MNHARTHIKNEKNDNNERCICAHAREKTQENMAFDFAFGAALAALFLLSAAAENRRVFRAFLCFFCRLRQQGSGAIIFPKENHVVRKTGLSKRKYEFFMNLSIFVQVLRTKTACRALLWEDFFPVTEHHRTPGGGCRAGQNRYFLKGVFL